MHEGAPKEVPYEGEPGPIIGTNEKIVAMKEAEARYKSTKKEGAPEVTDAILVMKAYDMYQNGKKFGEIADELTSYIRSKKGDPYAQSFMPGDVRNILEESFDGIEDPDAI